MFSAGIQKVRNWIIPIDAFGGDALKENLIE
jgi:hypothetical protein